MYLISFLNCRSISSENIFLLIYYIHITKIGKMSRMAQTAIDIQIKKTSKITKIGKIKKWRSIECGAN